MCLPKIDSFSSGNIIIDQTTYHKDVIIFPDRVLPNWWRESGHSLSLNDLEEVLAAPPQTLIIGTGVHGQVRVTGKTISRLEADGIQIFILKTPDACVRYNQMRLESRTIAALHLTC